MNDWFVPREDVACIKDTTISLEKGCIVCGRGFPFEAVNSICPECRKRLMRVLYGEEAQTCPDV